MRRKYVGIVDYGAGNIDSLKNILNKIDKSCGLFYKNQPERL